MPRVLIFTGDGKGKTTAALGMALRASGHGQTVYVLQFLKQDDSVGEVTALRGLPGVTVEQCGRGFVPKPDSPAYAEHKDAAQAGLTRLRERLVAGADDLIILDEVCGAIAKGLLAEADMLECIRSMPDSSAIALTGRNASAGLVEYADTVTEMRLVKHGYESGIQAQPGVEF